jgi:hypothetical protein
MIVKIYEYQRFANKGAFFLDEQALRDSFQDLPWFFWRARH